MKSGTLIIEQRDGQWGAWVRRADGEEIPLEGFQNPEQLKHKNGAACQYLKKKNQLVVRLENKEIFNQSSLSRQ